MEDNKLTEFVENAFQLILKYQDDTDYEMDDLKKHLRQIMPPTCKPNERKFLDRIKEIGYVSVSGVNLENKTMLAILNKAMFPDVNLSELVEKKDE